jgi:hypothetical protein
MIAFPSFATNPLQLITLQKSLDGVYEKNYSFLHDIEDSNMIKKKMSFPCIAWDEQEMSLEGVIRENEGTLLKHHNHHEQLSSSSSSSISLYSAGENSWGNQNAEVDEQTMKKEEEDDDGDCQGDVHDMSHRLLELSIHLPPHNRRRHHHHHHHKDRLLRHNFLHRTLAFDSNLASLDHQV